MKVKGAQAFAFGPPAIPGLGNGSGFSIMLQDKGGNTPQYLSDNMLRFIKAANSRPEIGSAFSTFTIPRLAIKSQGSPYSYKAAQAINFVASSTEPPPTERRKSMFWFFTTSTAFMQVS